MRRVLFSALLASFLIGCAQQQPYIETAPERAAAIRDGLSSLIQNGEPARAVARVLRYQREGLFSPEEATAFTSRAAGEIALELEEASAAADYERVLSALRSLHVLGAEIPDDSPTHVDLIQKHIDRLLEEEHAVVALSALLRSEHWLELSNDYLLRYAEVARGIGHHYALRMILEQLDTRDIVADTDLVAVAEKEPDLADMLSGTVTIWVNRGIRLESGMGRPDRVIGSGFFVDPRGYLITNYHVIESEVDPSYEGYSRLYVRLAGSPEQKVPARVVGYDRIFDVALLKVEVDPKYVFSITSIRDLRPGSKIFAIGSPGGLESSISSGIISAVGRRFLQIGDAVQVDVPINPGNSGGPLVSPSGDLIGVVFSGIEFFEGVNFAIPSYWIHYLFPDLYAGGEVSHPWIGVTTHRHRDGLQVGYVFPDSPADEAGIAAGDVLLALADWAGGTIGDAQSAILGLRTGELVPVRWQRSERNGTTTFDGLLSLSERPFSPVEDALKVQDYPDLVPVLFGMGIESTGGPLRRRDYVATTVYPGTVADETGLSEGDLLTVRGWEVDYDNRAAFLRIVVRKRKAGFMETAIQLASYLEVDNFL